MNKNSLKMNKTALITGASMGIGYELAKEFAKNGNNLVLVARSKDKLDTIAHELIATFGINALVITADLSKNDIAQEIYQELQQRGITIDYLINNAGFGDYGLFAESDWAKEAQMIDLNIKTLTHFCKIFVKDMIKNGSGKIMNVASTAAFQPGPTMAVYYATKSYVLSFSEAISNELEGTGVTVTALCPGPTLSNFQAAANLGESKLVKGKKLPTSAEVAHYGYKALMKGKVVAIHGWMNLVMATSIRFTPRALVLRIVRYMQDK
jgi:uncharacterized protein